MSRFSKKIKVPVATFCINECDKAFDSVQHYVDLVRAANCGDYDQDELAAFALFTKIAPMSHPKAGIQKRIVDEVVACIATKFAGARGQVSEQFLLGRFEQYYFTLSRDFLESSQFCVNTMNAMLLRVVGRNDEGVVGLRLGCIHSFLTVMNNDIHSIAT